eukprot:TRINITY_DN12296_c0_g10_i1.p1 TRINITY_DN12296_c0_g10~~TRINITY_DN12296_c0_g10_i1.p1  ORF type:complete len:104 (+),score=19.68 TRINITY_DN12296_c0_g10_i1:2-313(+)
MAQGDAKPPLDPLPSLHQGSFTKIGASKTSQFKTYIPRNSDHVEEVHVSSDTVLLRFLNAQKRIAASKRRQSKSQAGLKRAGNDDDDDDDDDVVDTQRKVYRR